MEKLIKKGKKLADQKRSKLRSDVKSALDEVAPDDVMIQEDNDGVTVTGPGLSDQLIENSDLRDVAFLMRGVR